MSAPKTPAPPVVWIHSFGDLREYIGRGWTDVQIDALLTMDHPAWGSDWGLWLIDNVGERDDNTSRGPVPPRPAAVLSDDAVMDALVTRYGMSGVNWEEDDDMSPCWPDYLAEDLGVFEQDWAHQERVMNAVLRLKDAGRLVLVGGGEWYAPSPAEWGRRIASRLGCHDCADEIAAVLKGEEG